MTQDAEASVSAERAVLAASIVFRPALLVASGLVSEIDFGVSQHRFVWRALMAIDKRGAPVDPVTLEDELRSAGDWSALGVLSADQTSPVASMGWLADLMHSAPSSSAIPHYAEIVTKHAGLRRLGQIGSDIAKMAADDPGEAQRLMLEAQRILTSVTRGRRKAGVDATELVQAALDQFELRQKSRDTGTAPMTGISTGLTGIDYLTGGLRDQTMTVVAARASIGKTAYACQVALLAALGHGIPVLIFSTEMGPAELMERFFSRRAHVNSHLLRSGQISKQDWQRLFAAGSEMNKPGLITISNATALHDVVMEARAFRVKNPDRKILTVVDYLQKVRASDRGRSREQEVAEVSAELKQQALDLNCPFLVPAQLNRGIENEERDPRLSDIRDSGAIEQDADNVMFITRKRGSERMLCTVHLLKQRNGPTGEAEAEWDGTTYDLHDAPTPVNGSPGDHHSRRDD